MRERNQVGLYAQLHALPWKDVTAKHYDRTAGNGRKETRGARVLTVDDLDFPQGVQDLQAHPRDRLPRPTRMWEAVGRRAVVVVACCP
ncbi:hypothetical protein [Streptomyces sp. NBC_01304]|uniref:hypothetical protein n=1 Tax=Streptomyces sp. NBC_01304 TaxID=2903818 RepID=UPI002E16067A|nr:hypothetical protein OG430_47125 [Streptomyces sp. NBC_01304]